MPDCRLALGGNGWSPCAANYQKRLGRWVEVGGSAGIACHHQRVDATRNSHNVMDEDLPDGAVQMRSDVSRTA